MRALAQPTGVPAGRVIVERIGRNALSLHALATLRMTVFRNWPYLYDGSADYEAAYLSEFLKDDGAVLVIARVGETPVGMATASPLATQSDVITAPFIAAGIDLEPIFYFGESVLLSQFHGMGIGHRFFDEREAAARAAGALQTSFCAVARPDDHPLRPGDARDLTPFWEKRGYRPVPHLETFLDWKDVGEGEETPHRMRFWMKTLD